MSDNINFKDNGLFDDVWDIRTQDEKVKMQNIIPTENRLNNILDDSNKESTDKSNNLSIDAWDSLLDYYEPTRKVIPIKDKQHEKVIKKDLRKPIENKTRKDTKPNTTKTITPKEKPIYDEDEYDDYDDTYDYYY